jgi:hypothetical protein
MTTATNFPALSPSMTRLLEFMRANGGRLIRHQTGHGGAWAGEKLNGRSWQTITIVALVDRDLAEFVRWETLPGAAQLQRPIEARLVISVTESLEKWK